jgi:hypothetical protein
MKKWMILLMMFALAGCDLSDDDYPDHEHHNHVLLLQLNYNTLEFEGGIELGIHSPLNEATTLPITVDYKEPGDFGYLKLNYQPLNEEIFHGTIVRNGTGLRLFPKLVYEKYFHRIDEALDYPDDERFQVIFPEEGTEFDLQGIWDSISKVRIVGEYLQSGKNIGVFLYQRSVGVDNPEEWSWYVVMNR